MEKPTSTRHTFIKLFVQIYILKTIYCPFLHHNELPTLSAQGVNSKNDRISMENIEDTFNKSLVCRVERRMYLDIGFIVDKDLHDSLKNLLTDVDSVFKEIALELADIFSWNGIEFSIKQLVVEEIDSDFYDYESEDWNSAVDKMHFRRVKNPLDYYILYHKKLNYTSTIYFFGNVFCKGDSMHLQEITLSENFNAKKIAEIIAGEFIKLHLVESAEDLNCECPYHLAELCITKEEKPNQSYNQITKMLSKCAVTELYLTAFVTQCFFDKDPRPRLYKKCGDGIVDKDEQCDCGTRFICKMTKQDHCCHYNNCTFKHESYQCSLGSCCKDCRFKKGSICRESYGECDPPESCNGLSFECPIDEVYDHYTMCNNGVGMCINGMCSSFDSLCKYVYTKESVFYDSMCYDYLISDFARECEAQTIHDDLKYVCNKIDKCNHFICATTKNILSHDIDTFRINTFRIGDMFCIIPIETSLIGLFKHSHNYLRCGDKDHNYCYNSTCVSDRTILPICDGGYCKDIDNSLKYTMDKVLYIKPERDHLLSYNYGIYLTTIKKVGIKIILPLISIIQIIFAIIFILVLISIIVWKRKIILSYYLKAKLWIIRVKLT